jgi:hypothetical protein
MTHLVIKTNNYILITSDEEIKEGDWVTDSYGVFRYANDNPCQKVFGDCKKIIAHLSLNNSPILDGVDLLPPLPMTFPTIECIGDNLWEELTGGQEVSVNRGDWSFGFGIGYNKAKEKYKFTEEDMRDAVEIACWNMIGKTVTESLIKDLVEESLIKDLVEKTIQSISQSKLPVGFNCEIEVECTGNDNNGCFMDAPGHNCGCVKTKITNGVMQGEWIFE